MARPKVVFRAFVKYKMLQWTKPTLIDGNHYFNFKKQYDVVLSPLDAAQATIEYITKNYPPPYTLYLSGGVDSQAMLYAWYKSGVDFRTFSAVYNGDLNQHDLNDLELFNTDYNIEINYHNFDLLYFLESEHERYAHTYRCGSPQITTFMKLLDLNMNGTAIMSGNFIVSSRYATGIPDRNNFSLYYYGLKSGRSVVPFFFLETHDLAHAFNCEIPEIKKHHTPGGYTDKVAAYQYYGFPVRGQQSKINGFEKVKELYDHKPPRMPSINDIINRIPGQTSNRNFDLLYRNKFESKFHQYKYFVQC